MAFVGGLMGPYMRPIPVGASAAMVFSLIIAFTITPWAAVHILKRKQSGLSGNTAAVETGHDPDHAPDDPFTRFYHHVMAPLLSHRNNFV